MSRVATPPTTQPTTTTRTVPHEKIAQRAYEKWLKSGCQHGCDTQHWFEAEAELKAELSRNAGQAGSTSYGRR